MLHNLSALLAPPVLERLTLVLNHVLGGEAVAMDKLRPHAGRALLLRLDGWPALLPPVPPMVWRVTPAGLLEFAGLEPAAGEQLEVHVDASNPALLMARGLLGERPVVRIEGDAQLAADLGWLLQNLRWDVGADLERVFGRTVGGQLHQLGRSLAGALRSALHAATPLVERLRPGSRSDR